MPLLRSTTGNETVGLAIAQVYVFYCPKQGKELSLHAASKVPETGVRKVGSSDHLGAVVGVPTEIGGSWVRSQHELPEDAILKIFAKIKPAWGKLITIACQFIQMRAQAPLHKIRIKLLDAPTTKLKQAEFLGRFDFLTLGEAKDRGVGVNPNFERMYNPRGVETLFQVDILEGEIVTKPEVISIPTKTESGKTVVVRRRERLRSMEIGD